MFCMTEIFPLEKASRIHDKISYLINKIKHLQRLVAAIANNGTTIASQTVKQKIIYIFKKYITKYENFCVKEWMLDDDDEKKKQKKGGVFFFSVFSAQQQKKGKIHASYC